MFNLFRKKSYLEKQIEKEGIDKVTSDVVLHISELIPNREIAYQFILEELDAAREGDDTAKLFVMESGIEKSEYVGAVNNSIPEVEGPEGPQQVLLKISMELYGNKNLMVKFHCMVDDKIMRRFKLGKYSPDNINFFKNKEKKRLIDVVERLNHQDHQLGPLEDLNRDLGYASEINNAFMDEPLLMMAYAYARRTAAAGLFLQGHQSLDDYNYVQGMFEKVQMIIDDHSTIEFHTEAANQAEEILKKYYSKFTKVNIALLIFTASQGVGINQFQVNGYSVLYLLYGEKVKIEELENNPVSVDIDLAMSFIDSKDIINSI